jgi:hypothetical protein
VGYGGINRSESVIRRCRSEEGCKEEKQIGRIKRYEKEYR